MNKIAPKENLLAEAKAWAQKLAAKPRVAMTLLKHSIDHGMDMDLLSALTFETDCFVQAYVSEDGREGFQAFIGGRENPLLRGDKE